MAGVYPHQCGHRHHHQHDDFDGEQDPLEPGRHLDAAVADVGHHDDPQDPHQQHPAAGGVGSNEVFRPLNKKKRYWPATWARLPMTRRSAATVAQPPAQPTDGPNALVPQMKVVPQSGSALFSSLKPIEHSSIGTNASTATSGAFSPTAATTKNSVAARL